MKELLTKFNIGNPNFMTAALFVSVIAIGYFSFPKPGITKKEIDACKIEEGLEFEGVITEYNGEGMKTSPTIFILSDSIYTIPRYNIEMQIALGDTIKKIINEHKYYIRRRLNVFKRLDTIVFNCDIKEQN